MPKRRLSHRRWGRLFIVILPALLTSATSITTMAQSTQSPIVIWPNGAPGAVGKQPEDIPTLTPFLPAREKATGAAVIVFPGGGYTHLAEHEGRPVAEWLNSLGINMASCTAANEFSRISKINHSFLGLCIGSLGKY